jgi:hypothetical protein
MAMMISNATNTDAPDDLPSKAHVSRAVLARLGLTDRKTMYGVLLAYLASAFAGNAASYVADSAPMHLVGCVTGQTRMLDLLRFLMRLVGRQRCSDLALRLFGRPCRVVVPETVVVGFSPKPNVVFEDMLWYISSTEALDDTVLTQETSGDQAGGPRMTTNLNHSRVVREFRHGAHVGTIELRTDSNAKGVLGNTVEARVIVVRTVVFSAASATNPCHEFILHVQREKRQADSLRAWKLAVHRFAPSTCEGMWKGREVPDYKRFAHVAMQATDKAALRADLETFFGSKDSYHGRGLAWNRGYLFHGPPGCGKTSCISAIANEFRLPVYSVDLSEVPSDAVLRAMFGGLPERVMVVIEDVDCASDAVLDRAKKVVVECDIKPQSNGTTKAKPTITLSGLLNVIDGVEANVGRVLVLTTNHKDRLDPALTRPGRCDVHVELGYCTWEHVEFLARLYLGEDAAATVRAAAADGKRRLRSRLTPAEAAGKMLAATALDLAEFTTDEEESSSSESGSGSFGGDECSSSASSRSDLLPSCVCEKHNEPQIVHSLSGCPDHL